MRRGGLQGKRVARLGDFHRNQRAEVRLAACPTQSGAGLFASTFDAPSAHIDDGNAVVTALRVGMNLVFRHHLPPFGCDLAPSARGLPFSSD